MDTKKEQIKERITRQRYHGLYLSRQCPDIVELSRELLGLHCWFYRNVVFSALIRGAANATDNTALTKTWLYQGRIYCAAHDELPTLLALHSGDSWLRRYYSEQTLTQIMDEVIRYMEDGVYSRAEMRRIFSDFYEPKIVATMFSSWGGIFVHLAGLGKVAFRDMTSRDFDLIDAQPIQTSEEVLPGLLRRYFKAYGPATLDDAACFFGFSRADKASLQNLVLNEYDCFELDGKEYYHCGQPEGMGDIPELCLLSGFDPVIFSYADRNSAMPGEYKERVILKSGIYLPTIAVHGKIAGIWNIKDGEPVVEFFENQPRRIQAGALEQVEIISYQYHRKERARWKRWADFD